MMICISLDRLRGKVMELLGLEMDWANYNYIVEDENCVITYWLKDTTFEDYGRIDYKGTYADKLTGESRTIIYTAIQGCTELPAGGYRVYDPTKKNALKRAHAFSQKEKCYIYASPFYYSCQGEDIVQLEIRRHKALTDNGAVVSKVFEDGSKQYEAPIENERILHSITAAFRQDRPRARNVEATA